MEDTCGIGPVQGTGVHARPHTHCCVCDMPNITVPWCIHCMIVHSQYGVDWVRGGVDETGQQYIMEFSIADEDKGRVIQDRDKVTAHTIPYHAPSMISVYGDLHACHSVIESDRVTTDSTCFYRFTTHPTHNPTVQLAMDTQVWFTTAGSNR